MTVEREKLRCALLSIWRSILVPSFADMKIISVRHSDVVCELLRSIHEIRQNSMKTIEKTGVSFPVNSPTFFRAFYLTRVLSLSVINK